MQGVREAGVALHSCPEHPDCRACVHSLERLKMMAAHVGCPWTCFQIVAGELRCGHVEGLDQVRPYIPVPAWCSPALLTTPSCCALLHVDLPTTLTCHCSCQLLPAPESLALFATGIICAVQTRPSLPAASSPTCRRSLAMTSFALRCSARRCVERVEHVDHQIRDALLKHSGCSREYTHVCA